jgi:ABC-type transport system substrate-binding protein
MNIRWIALTGLMTVIFVVSIACSGGDEQDAPAAAALATAAPALTSVPTAVVPLEPKLSRAVISTPPPSIEGNDPNKELGGLSTFQIQPMFEWLVGIDAEKGTVYPMLAESWSVEPDGFSYRFKLRKGVPFHNDKGEFTAEDVISAHAVLTAEDSLVPVARNLRGDVVTAVNDHELVWTPHKPNAEFLAQVGERIAGMEIQSTSDRTSRAVDMTTTPWAGTGSYQFVERVQGMYVRFERVPYQHWRLKGDIPELEFRWMAEASTRLAALQTGEIHITTLPEDLVKQAEGEGMKVYRGTQEGRRAFFSFRGVYVDEKSSCGFKFCDTPLLDVNVRKAMNKAIDRDALNSAFFGNKGIPMYMNHIPNGHPAFNPDWERNFPQEYGFDPAAARQLLADSGYSSSKPVKTRMHIRIIPAFGGAQDVQEAVAGFWQDIGIDAELVTLDPAALRAKGRKGEVEDLVSMAISSSFDIQGWRVYNSHVPPAYVGYETAELNSLSRQMQSSMEIDQQYALLGQIGNLAYTDHVGIPLFWIPAEVIGNPEFIESYSFPGSLSQMWTHVERIKGAR